MKSNLSLKFLSLALLAAVPSQAMMLIEVDRSTQTITVKTPQGDWTDKVSTGGGLKFPNGVEAQGRSPYCANNVTPSLDQVYFPAITDGPGTNMKPVHYSNTFSDQQGNKIAMPWAINLGAGIYFHEAPPSYVGLLGKNVSGGCIRLSPARAKQLYSQMIENGGATVSIFGENPEVNPGDRSYCDKEMILEARARLSDQKMRTGREANSREVSNIFSAIYSAFSGQGDPSAQGQWTTTVEKPKAKKQSRSKSTDDSWATHPLGQF